VFELDPGAVGADRGHRLRERPDGADEEIVANRVLAERVVRARVATLDEGGDMVGVQLGG